MRSRFCIFDSPNIPSTTLESQKCARAPIRSTRENSPQDESVRPADFRSQLAARPQIIVAPRRGSLWFFSQEIFFGPIKIKFIFFLSILAAISNLKPAGGAEKD
ncbi:MAG: hypothetical protein DME62_05250 [Verrucomicrobia bacterium]|nr:MAG: hypothetical protein DME62_05250 [Verrucomicrobiota bacterium]